MNRMTAASTRMLASGRLELSSRHRLRAALEGAAFATLVAVALAALSQLEVVRPSAGATRLAQENAALRAEIASVRAELGIEHSTRRALDAQLRELSAQTGELRRQLEFVTAQSGRSRDGGR